MIVFVAYDLVKLASSIQVNNEAMKGNLRPSIAQKQTRTEKQCLGT